MTTNTMTTNTMTLTDLDALVDTESVAEGLLVRSILSVLWFCT